MINDTLGSHIRKLRKQRNLTLREVSEQSSISLSYISDIERNIVNPSYDILCQLSDVFNITVPEIVNVNNIYQGKQDLEEIEILENLLSGINKLLDIKTKKEV